MCWAASTEPQVRSTTANRITWADLGREPFRVFFPQGVLAGILGVGLWPLYFTGLTTFYPGQAHARVMAYGLFGGFIFGFMGTAMPRLLSVPVLGSRNALTLLSLHLAMVLAFAGQKIFCGDVLFLSLLLLFLTLMLRRLRHRQDTPPPGFTLVGAGFPVCSHRRGPRPLSAVVGRVRRLLDRVAKAALLSGVRAPSDFGDRPVPSASFFWAAKPA